MKNLSNKELHENAMRFERYARRLTRDQLLNLREIERAAGFS